MIENIKRNVLLNPGPATTTDTVKLAQIVPDICPREKEFGNIMKNIQDDLVKIVHGDETYTSVLFCGSGTINIDVCINSLLPENKKILVVNNGVYSSRAVEVCKYYNLPYIELKYAFDQLPDLIEIEDTLKNNKDIAMVYTTHNETASGILNPIKQIGEIAHKYNAYFCVDTTSTYAMIPINVVEDNIDFCMASSQKGLMAMTSLSFIVGKIDIIEKSKDFPKRSYYCNLYMQYDYFRKNNQMHFTPPVQTIYSVKQAIKEYFEEGELNKYERHIKTSQRISYYLNELGFEELIPKENQSGLVISIKEPNDENWNFEKIHDYCYERGFTIYPGTIKELKNFRLCSLGAITYKDIDDFFVVFKEALKYYNVKVPIQY